MLFASLPAFGLMRKANTVVNPNKSSAQKSMKLKRRAALRNADLNRQRNANRLIEGLPLKRQTLTTHRLQTYDVGKGVEEECVKNVYFENVQF